MAKTPSGGSAPYCTASEFLDYFDSNYAGQLANDDGSAATVAELASDDQLAACLAAASGEVEAACLAGERYQPEDLTALLANDGNSAALLRSLVAILAMARLARRRGWTPEALEADLKEARELIDQLRSGARIFAFEEVQEAGLPDTYVLTQRDMRDQNYVSGETRYFGRRQWSRRYLGN